MQYSLDLVFSEPPRVPIWQSEKDFYKTTEWLRVRYDAIQRNDGKCDCCKRKPTPCNPLHVDHIKPRSRFPWLALDPDNLQVLCKECNFGKGNVDWTDWR